MSLRVLIVDDEPLARGRLRALLEAEPDVAIIGACDDGREALQIVRQDSPDVIFLDVRMPEMDGFAFLESLPAESRPLVIIVTGHKKYAAQAFEVHAVDFLLKPFDRERLRMTLRRARERIQTARQSEIHKALSAMRQRFTSSPEVVDRISIKSNGRILFLKLDEIDWIGAADNYAEFHTGQSTHLLLSTLTALEARLPTARFVRISRCAIINASRVKELRLDRPGRCTVVLHGGTELVVSSAYRRTLDQLLRK